MAHQQQQGQFDSELLESPPPELVILLDENQEDENQIYIEPSEVYKNKKHNQTSESNNNVKEEGQDENVHDSSRDNNNKKKKDKTETGIKRGKYGKISNERRQILIDIYENEGLDLKYVAKLLRIHYKTAWNIVSEYKKTSRINRSDRRKSGPRAKKLTEEVLEQIKEIVKEHSKYSLKQVKRELEQKNPGFTISTSSIDFALKNLKLRESRKKSGRRSK